MEAILIVVLRTLGMYFIIFLILRLMGKRELGEISIFDLVIFIMLAEMAVISIENLEKGFFYSIVPMVILLIIQRLSAKISLKSQKVREMLDGKPSIIIQNGKIDEQEMKHQRYNMDDLLINLHEKGIQLVQDVELAILEPNGKLSVFEKKNNPVQIYSPLISDGTIQHHVLKQIEKDENWLKEELKKLGYNQIDSISYCSMNKDGTLYVDESNLNKE
ncbi:Uncharacterized membrane protein YcaP, DUF421 family [Salinibacillus kushneri]|uniref:Uncharacterized membrane protein YcaP, DUF421 family n=1 Tax=Salinibacillus kushneri TaxID=237682 RepID=A0A1I0G894_9BACI|nr:DUF421 domain-containing protein [Salinibacillus kushneri]SET67136.1 Uncharacterized membrane protein YcaP, DUF421 family [Salinibacillus kushneri]